MWSVKSETLCTALQSQSDYSGAAMATGLTGRQIFLNRTICQCSVISLVKGSFLFAFVGQMAVQSFVPGFHILLVIHCGDPQAMPTPNGTSFDFVTTENGPVCLDLYSTPQYKLDQQGDCTGELCFPALSTWSNSPLYCQVDRKEHCATFLKD